MPRRCNNNPTPVSRRFHSRRQSGLTLLELMIAMTILTFIVGTMAALAHTAEQEFEYSEGYGAAAQHARVALDRITRAIYGATANEQFPGCLVLTDTVNGYTYPDTLVVWRPSGTAAAPAGLPLYCELVIYCPHPSNPNLLVEITAPSDMRTVPAASDTTTWINQIGAVKTSAQSKIVTLSNLMRACPISTSTGAAVRGAVRFAMRLRPSQDDWTNFKNNSTAWKNLPWVQGCYGWQTGMRQVWVRMELQIMPQAPNGAASAANLVAVPFFGSASFYYQLHRQ
jgi:prepilin-type N-terminal cleavage/methylation domain-containing protein